MNLQDYGDTMSEQRSLTGIIFQKLYVFLGIFLFLGLFFVPISAESSSDAFADKGPGQDGAMSFLSLDLELKPGWHTYANPAGDVGLAPRIEWQEPLPKGLKTGALLYAPATRIASDGLVSYGYYDSVRFYLPLDFSIRNTVKLNSKESDSALLTGTFHWLACKESCQPFSQSFQIDLDSKESKTFGPLTLSRVYRLPSDVIYSEQAQIIEDETGFFHGEGHEKALGSLLALLFAAFIGGLILNLMPCVLPVLSLKALKLTKQSGAADGRVASLYLSGVLVSLIALAVLVLGLRAQGLALGWGFHLQSAAFVWALVLLFMGMGVNLLGGFEIGASLSALAETGNGKQASQAESRPGLDAFLSGVLTTIVATPCSAPFIGTAVGAAFLLPSWQALLIFLFMGLGLALPMVLIIAIPALQVFIPKPGRWMLRFKQFMGVLMLASMLWLLWVFYFLVTETVFYLSVTVLGLLAAALWRYGRFQLAAETPGQRRMLILAVLLIIVSLLSITGPIRSLLDDLGRDMAGFRGSIAEASGDSFFDFQNETAVSEGQWEAFSPALVAELEAKEQAYFVDFTAAWCVTCQVNKQRVLSKESVLEAFSAKGVRLLRADWTNRDPVISEFLLRYQRQSVPVYLFFDGKTGPEILPEILSEADLLQRIEKI